MDELVPAYYITPKIAYFTGIEDPENHVMTFNAQMIIFGGTNAFQCKMLIEIFTGTTLQLFSGIPDGQITFFSHFSIMFRESFFANIVKPLRMYDLYGVRKREGQPLKDYLNRFNALTIRVQTHDEDMMIAIFEQGIAAGLFSNSLIRNPAETFFEV